MTKARLHLGLATLALVGAGLAGCSNIPSNRGVYSVHQPVVERQLYSMDVNLSGDTLATGEADRLGGWFDAMGLGYGDRIAVDTGDGYAGPGVRRDIADIAGQKGMLVADLAPTSEGAIQPGTARVVVTRSRASVPGCPNWSQQSETDFTSGTHSNYGCAMAQNYAAMIADPEDLVRGRETGATDPLTASKAVEAQRRRPATAGQTSGGGVGGN
jgi:pilus assembly protein CpaD